MGHLPIAPQGAQSRAVEAHFVVEEKGIFLNFKSLTGHSKTETAQSGQRGTFMPNGVGHLSCHIWALMASAEPGNIYCPRQPFSLPLKGHMQSRAVEEHFVVEEKGIFLNFKVPKCKFLPLTGQQSNREGKKWAFFLWEDIFFIQFPQLKTTVSM